MRLVHALALPLLAVAAAAVAAEDAPVFVTAHYRDQAQLRRIAPQFQHLIVDRTARTVRVEASPDDIAALRRAGLRVEVDAAATAQLQRMQAAMAKAPLMGPASIPGYACYRTVEETYATMDDLAAAKPQLAQLRNIGPSWEKSRNAAAGYEMRVLRISNTATDAALPNKPTMVVLGSIHAREYTPAELLTRFAEWLVNGYGNDAEATWLVDNFAFQFVLQANPDGRKKAEAGASWRKNTDNANGSCSASSIGVDLNRNFPFHWNGAGGSSGNACAETYRGPSSASEPETQNLVRLIAGTRNANGVYTGGLFPDRRGDATSSPAPDDYQGLFFDIHSYSQLVLWSWGDTTAPAPNSTALQTLGRRLAYFNNYRPQQSNELYPTDGTTDDTMYGLLGVPSYTIELGVAFFESCSSFQNSTLPNNLRALRYAARNLQAPYRYPAGPDTQSVSASAATVPAGTPVTITASVSDATFNQSNGTEAVQNIASASAYLDAPPWAPGASAIAMSASDGSYNASAETVTLSLSTAGLSPGVHTVYVQATDAAGKPGTPNAVRFTVSGSGGNAPPVANFTSSASGLTVAFNDTSSDSDGSIVSRSWNFGDGTTSTAASPSKTYAAAGSYTVTLTVTDDDGATNTKTASVTVGTGGVQTYSNATDVNIPDNNATGATSSIAVSGRSGNAPADAKVSVNIQHPYRGDLVVDLIAPDGTAYNLHNRSGTSADHVIITDRVIDLSSETLNGTWKLRAIDRASQDVGYINSWSLTF
ncbi:M14 family zinc carboxypeptidase [Lysobacter silvisoli]|uniref:M14 family zinc carboxypeptidase n=1 Tax=Lysobacter silvisoli TaxID=2293254 RepID=UPI001313F88A|nr:M14 family zinc carboxypeptidase [Lysobacter silvisoli]